MRAYDPNYTVRSIVFDNMEHSSACNTLKRGQEPNRGHIRALETYLAELKEEASDPALELL